MASKVIPSGFTVTRRAATPTNRRGIRLPTLKVLTFLIVVIALGSTRVLNFFPTLMTGLIVLFNRGRHSYNVIEITEPQRHNGPPYPIIGDLLSSFTIERRK
ncbi:hypothetical protein TIFTF001_029419 [Ficus carica]|uniref:Transmembrane protein n=1 Tax=Ficus carica TaxID=3494 RepID=A0AA88J3D3_FICCA|nr:hypothetical protein TIFTF001_029419 [Ficus carica]